ncbi:hypothetical protein FWH13_03820 [Candidatus Saccharibacteria bacterium]|nr:hypothetical protein [Candidatus Saccharibacteria bacterium]
MVGRREDAAASVGAGANPVVNPAVRQFFAAATHPIIGIAGTVGKRTIAEMLKLMKLGDYVIYPMQARDLRGLDMSPQVAVLNTIDIENPVEYGEFKDYYNVLENVTHWQRENDLTVYDARDEECFRMAAESKGRKVAVPNNDGLHLEFTGDSITEEKKIWLVDDMEKLAEVTDLRLYPHEWHNALMALGVARALGMDMEKAVESLREYKRLPEHLQLVRTVDDEDFYNDAASVVPMATMAALRAIMKPKILLVGGQEVGLDYTLLASKCQELGVKRVMLLGETAKRLQQEFLVARFPNVENLATSTVGDVVRAMTIYAETGDAVILSPGAPNSWGGEFTEAVNSL